MTQSPTSPPNTDAPPAATPAHEASPRPTGLAGLARMSTTAGVGLQDYRAVNPLAVAGLVCGVAAWVSLLNALLLVVPALAVLFGLVAIWQILKSNGTQGGLLLAAAGIALGLGIGGYVVADEVSQRRSNVMYRAEIHQTVDAFGEALAARDWEAAYALTSASFRQQVPLERFGGLFVGLNASVDAEGNKRVGWPTGATTNDRAEITIDPTTGIVYAETLLITSFEASQPDRQPIRLVRTADGWRIQQFVNWFPPQ